jgi:hypothetical protein
MPLKMNDISVFFIFISSKLTLVASLNDICNCKPLCSCLCDYKLFLLGGTKDSHIYNHKNGWFGHKLQTHGLEWAWLFVVPSAIVLKPKVKVSKFNLKIDSK